MSYIDWTKHLEKLAHKRETGNSEGSGIHMDENSRPIEESLSPDLFTRRNERGGVCQMEATSALRAKLIRHPSQNITERDLDLMIS